MENYKKLLFVMLIAIILVAVLTQKYEILVSIVALAGIYFYMKSKTENLESPEEKKEVTFDEGPTIDQLYMADNEDSMAQRIIGVDVGGNEIDNSDIVNQIITGGNDPYQSNWKSNSVSNYHTNPDPNKRNSYDIALSGKVNADERLAIRQQFTSSLNKRAIDGKVRTQVPMFKRMFQDELEQNETREWWTAEGNPMESDMNNYS